MGTFYGSIVLTPEVDPSDEERVRAYAASHLDPMMLPLTEDGYGSGPFWFYDIVSKNWYSSHSQDFPKAVFDSTLILEKVEDLIENMPYVLITPDGTWHQSRTTYLIQDDDWPRRFSEISAPFRECLALAIWFKC